MAVLQVNIFVMLNLNYELNRILSNGAREYFNISLASYFLNVYLFPNMYL
jgi:hypothetical protein